MQNDKKNVKKPFYKRTWFIVIAIIIVLGIIGSYLGSSNNGKEPNDNSEIANIGISPTEIFSSTPNITERTDTIQNESASPSDTLVPTIEIPQSGLVMFNQDNIIISLTKIDRDRSGYVTDIELLIENNGNMEKNVRTTPNVWSVVKINNITFKSTFAVAVTPGKKATSKLNLDSDEVKLFDIKNIYGVSIQFQTDDPSNNYMITNAKVYDPSYLKIADIPEYGDFGGGKLVFTNDKADVYACGFTSSIIYKEAVFVIKNKAGYDLKYDLASVSIDGYMSGQTEQSGDIYNDTYRAFYVPLDDKYKNVDVGEIEFTLKEEDFLSIISLNKTDVGVVTIDYNK